MGLWDKVKARADARHEAEALSALQQAEAEAAEQAAIAAFAAEQELDPRARLEQPEWIDALSKAKINPRAIRDVLNGNRGIMWTPGDDPYGFPRDSSAPTGAVVLTEGRLAYAFRGGLHAGIRVVVRETSEVAQLRKVDKGGAIHVVFKTDRSFPDRGNERHLADYWEIKVPPRDEVRDAFRRAGCNV